MRMNVDSISVRLLVWAGWDVEQTSKCWMMGKNDRNHPYVMVKSMVSWVSCKISQQPTQWWIPSMTYQTLTFTCQLGFYVKRPRAVDVTVKKIFGLTSSAGDDETFKKAMHWTVTERSFCVVLAHQTRTENITEPVESIKSAAPFAWLHCIGILLVLHTILVGFVEKHWDSPTESGM